MITLHHTFKDKTVLVTGHTGFKGGWLTLWLTLLGAKVIGISDTVPTTPSFYDACDLNSLLHLDLRHDVRDAPTIKKIITESKPNFIFHLAAQPIVLEAYQDPINTISTNVMGTASVLEALRHSTHPCIGIIITSDKCYENLEWCWGYRENDRLGGKDIYSGSKSAAENIFHAYFHSFFNNQEKIKLATARAGNVIGGGDWAANRIIPDCIRSWSKNQPVNIRHPQATRPWQHVLEPLGGYLSLAQELSIQNNLHGEAFNFGPRASEIYSVKDVVERLESCWHYNVSTQFNHNTDQHEASLLKLNCDKALTQLDWQSSLSFQTAIEWTGDWYSQFYGDEVNMADLSIKQITQYQENNRRG